MTSIKIEITSSPDGFHFFGYDPISESVIDYTSDIEEEGMETISEAFPELDIEWIEGEQI